MDGGMNIRMRKKDWLILGGKLATRIVKDTDKGISQDKDGKKFNCLVVLINSVSVISLILYASFSRSLFKLSSIFFICTIKELTILSRSSGI